MEAIPDNLPAIGLALALGAALVMMACILADPDCGLDEDWED